MAFVNVIANQIYQKSVIVKMNQDFTQLIPTEQDLIRQNQQNFEDTYRILFANLNSRVRALEQQRKEDKKTIETLKEDGKR